MLNWNTFVQWVTTPLNIRVRLIDEFGNHIDPRSLREIDYLARFQNRAVVGKIYNEMVADKRTGTIEVYQDKVVVKEG